ncbi:MAG: aldo/keto reductase, partial [Candidatus Latescibacteria bacterium]|nr:aldo/keto reductase [Candidatus Latescibacterota bacterium]
ILHDQGKVKSIGVSNFSIPQVEEAQAVSPAPVCANQVRYHVGHSQEMLLQHHRGKGVTITAYCPLARGESASDQALRAIGDRHGKSAAQVALRWLVQKQVVVIPKASSKEHLSANMDIFAWALTPAEMTQLDRI